MISNLKTNRRGSFCNGEEKILDKIFGDIASFKYQDDANWKLDIDFYFEKMRYLDNKLASLMDSPKVENHKVSFVEVFQKISDVLLLLNNYIMSIENKTILIKFSRGLSQDQEFLDICKKFDSVRGFLNQYSYLGFDMLRFDFASCARSDGPTRRTSDVGFLSHWQWRWLEKYAPRFRLH